MFITSDRKMRRRYPNWTPTAAWPHPFPPIAGGQQEGDTRFSVDNLAQGPTGSFEVFRNGQWVTSGGDGGTNGPDPIFHTIDGVRHVLVNASGNLTRDPADPGARFVPVPVAGETTSLSGQLREEVSALADVLLRNGLAPTRQEAERLAAIQITGVDPSTGGGAPAPTLQQEVDEVAAVIRRANPGLDEAEVLRRAQESIGVSTGSPTRSPEEIALDQAREQEIQARIGQFAIDNELLRDQIALGREQNQRDFVQRQEQFLADNALRTEQLELQLQGLSQDAQQAAARLGFDYTALSAEVGVANANLQIRTQELQSANQRFAAQLGLDYQGLVASIGQTNADRLLRHAELTADIETQNALRRFQSAEGAQQRSLALTELRASDERARQQAQIEIASTLTQEEQSRLQQRQALVGDIARSAQSPGDVGQLAALLQAAGPGQAGITTALTAGQDAISNESLAPQAAQLGLLDELRQPSQASALLRRLFAELDRRNAALFDPLAQRLTQPTPTTDILPPGSPALVPLPGAPDMGGFFDALTAPQAGTPGTSTGGFFDALNAPPPGGLAGALLSGPRPSGGGLGGVTAAVGNDPAFVAQMNAAGFSLVPQTFAPDGGALGFDIVPTASLPPPPIPAPAAQINAPPPLTDTTAMEAAQATATMTGSPTPPGGAATTTDIAPQEGFQVSEGTTIEQSTLDILRDQGLVGFAHGGRFAGAVAGGANRIPGNVAIVGDDPRGGASGFDELLIDPTADSTVIPLNPPGGGFFDELNAPLTGMAAEIAAESAKAGPVPNFLRATADLIEGQVTAVDGQPKDFFDALRTTPPPVAAPPRPTGGFFDELNAPLTGMAGEIMEAVPALAHGGAFENAANTDPLLGGFFNTAFGQSVTPELIDRAMRFATRTTEEALRRSGGLFNTLADVAPIKFARPGQDPFVTQLAESIARTAGLGGDPFFREQQRLTPRGVPNRAIGRTR